MVNIVQLYIEEQKKIESLKRKDPAFVTPSQRYSYEQILALIGITVDFGYLPQGYLNLYHQDFIVEEITSDGRLTTIEPGSTTLGSPSSDKNKTIYADLVKTGLSTIEAVKSIAETLEIDVKQIAFAGIKDKVALTSQQISIRKAQPKKIEELSVPGLLLKNFTWGKGVSEKGNLLGNRFTIVVRTSSTLGQGWLDQSLNRVKDGFYNFYYLQRFGTPRLLSHKLGKLILQQRHEETVKVFLTNTGVQFVPYLNQYRQKADQLFGDWQHLEELFKEMPYTFRLELKILSYLKNNPKDFHGALREVDDQTTLWVYAYASYLFNLTLSDMVNKSEPLPDELALLLNPNYLDVASYREHLKQDKILNVAESVKKMFGRVVMSEKNMAPTKTSVKVIDAKVIDRAAVLSFELGVGSYATTFLMHLFNIYRGLPLPEWLDQTKHDSKKILNLGSITATEEKLGEYMFNQAD